MTRRESSAVTDRRPDQIRDAVAHLSSGTKLDTGKLRHDLLPPDAMGEVARIFTFGAEKYADRNWEKGMDWGRVYAAQQRHMMAFWGGEMYDPETGMLHTAHATFGTLVLTAYSLRGAGNDTRGEFAGPDGLRHAALRP